jgi:hypothetical protein
MWHGTTRHDTTRKQTISNLVERACISKLTGYKDDGCSINVQVRGGGQQRRSEP